MAGSYEHCCKDDDGSFRNDDFTDMIENLGDAYEACYHMHWMIHHLASADKDKIKQASDAYYAWVRAGNRSW